MDYGYVGVDRNKHIYFAKLDDKKYYWIVHKKIEDGANYKFTGIHLVIREAQYYISPLLVEVDEYPQIEYPSDCYDDFMDYSCVLA